MNAIPAAVAATAIPSGLTVTDVIASELEHPWVAARRLAKELSAVLEQIEDASMMAIIEPASGRHPVLFADREFYQSQMARLQPEPSDLLTLTRQYAALAQALDPSIIGVTIGYEENMEGPIEDRCNGVFLSRSARHRRPNPDKRRIALGRGSARWMEPSDRVRRPGNP